MYEPATYDVRLMVEACLQSKMGTEVGHASPDIQTTAPPSTATTSAPKMSMFAKRAGFVIPKNKLSGSLVPVYRSSKKGNADSLNEEATKQVQRKTKWGPDLTMDATVRKGRASAYQTRIEQISQQLTLGVLELEDNKDKFFTSETGHGKTSDHQLPHEEMEQLELERREIIGEILKLNPAFKAPADYKPLLKEAKVPIPIKEHPGYNFIGLIFGPSSDTQKRVEKETGAKIQVYGLKANTGGQVEITPDGKVDDSAYEHMYVNVSADTYDKVDAAVALIELLITSVLANPGTSSTTSIVASDDNVNTDQGHSMQGSTVAPAMTNQGTAQPYPTSLQLPQQFPQYPQPWFPAGPTQMPIYLQSGLVTPANASASFLSGTAQISSSPLNKPPLFGARPIIPASFSPVLQNPSASPSGPQPLYGQHIKTGGPQPPYMQQAHPLTGNCPRNLPLTSKPPFSAVDPARWLPSPVSTSASQGPTNIMPVTTAIPSHGPPVSIPNDMILPMSVAGQSSGPVANQVAMRPPPSNTTPPSIRPIQPAMPQMALRPPPSNAVPGSAPMPFPMQSSGSFSQHGIPNSFPDNAPNFDSIRPIPGAIPRPQQPSSGDFTFQPHRPPSAAAPQVWQHNQGAPHNIRHPAQGGQISLGPQSAVTRPVMHNMNPPPAHGFLRPQFNRQVNQPRGQISTNFAGNQTVPGPPRHPMLPGHNARPMQPRHFVPQMHGQEIHLGRPPRFSIPYQHFGNNPAGGQQVYDPFSPTSVSFNSQMGGNANAARIPNESDPEYDDLMASVGVK